MFEPAWVKMELGFSFRSRMDIVASILHVAVGGSRKTRIMYRCNLSFRQLQTYLDLVLNTGLLEKKGSNPTFQTTAKGRAFLKAYHNLATILES